jgi:hypothetical protein
LPVLATYRLAKRHRDIVYVAGHVSATLDGSNLIRGKVGADLTLGQSRGVETAARRFDHDWRTGSEGGSTPGD